MENELSKISYSKIEGSAFSSKPNLTINFGIYMIIKYILNEIKCCMLYPQRSKIKLIICHSGRIVTLV